MQTRRRRAAVRLGVGLVAVVLAGMVVISGRSQPVRQGPESAYPDAVLTPGAVLPDVTTEVVCSPDVATTLPEIDASVSAAVFAAYGLTDDPDRYQLDALIPLTLGGAPTAENLWPQAVDAMPGSREKDQAEAYTLGRVCDGSITLAAAQQSFREDWVAVYQGIGGAVVVSFVASTVTPTPTPTVEPRMTATAPPAATMAAGPSRCGGQCKIQGKGEAQVKLGQMYGGGAVNVTQTLTFEITVANGMVSGQGSFSAQFRFDNASCRVPPVSGTFRVQGAYDGSMLRLTFTGNPPHIATVDCGTPSGQVYVFHGQGPDALFPSLALEAVEGARACVNQVVDSDHAGYVGSFCASGEQLGF